jgi:hypothetical protein
LELSYRRWSDGLPRTDVVRLHHLTVLEQIRALVTKKDNNGFGSG